MRLTKFIGQNKEKWIEFEENFKLKRKDPDKLSKLFIQITDDLSYARAAYPNRSIKVYLNGLAQQVFQTLYKNRKTNTKRLKTFWTDELPQIIYQSRRVFLLAFVIFWASFAIGVMSTKYDHDFANLILGKEYVNMTNENIKKGDPLGVYKDKDEGTMFLQIVWNNLKVDLLTFIGGLVASLGALMIMVYNGIMVGTFQYFFVQRGLFTDSFFTVWVHGTLEVSAIIISAAAGMILGSGLVFPGTYGRLQAFRLSARKGIKIMIGMAPITVAAAFLEGFVTRYTEAPIFLRLGIILLSLLFIVSYYVYYPWRLARKGFAKPLEEEDLPPQQENQVKLDVIRETGDVFTDLFSLYKIYFKRIVISGLVFTALFTVAYYFLVGKKYGLYGGDDLEDNLFLTFFRQFWMYFRVKDNMLMLLFDGALFLFVNTLTLVTFRVFILSQRTDEKAMPFRTVLKQVLKKQWFNLLVINSIMTATLLLGSSVFFLILIIYPVLMLWQVSLVAENGKLGPSFSRAIAALRSSVMTYILLLIVSIVFLFVTNSPLVWLGFQLVELNYKFDTAAYNLFYMVYVTFLSIMSVVLVIPVMVYGLCLAYASHIEVNEAHGLMDRIMTIGAKRKLYGLEQEA